jgi:hypothetical protein
VIRGRAVVGGRLRAADHDADRGQATDAQHHDGEHDQQEDRDRAYLALLRQLTGIDRSGSPQWFFRTAHRYTLIGVSPGVDGSFGYG